MLVNIYMLLAFLPQSVLFSLVHQEPNLYIYSSMFFLPSQHRTSFSVACCEMHAYGRWKGTRKKKNGSKFASGLVCSSKFLCYKIKKKGLTN